MARSIATVAVGAAAAAAKAAGVGRGSIARRQRPSKPQQPKSPRGGSSSSAARSVSSLAAPVSSSSASDGEGGGDEGLAVSEREAMEQIADSAIGSAAGLGAGVYKRTGNDMDWSEAAQLLADHLGIDMNDEASRRRILEYYLPVVEWVAQAQARHAARSDSDAGPLVVGISAPQGCGKSTIVDALVRLLPELKGLSTVNVSIDDFYLTRADQQKLADENASNGLLQVRGNAGTHDLELGMQTIEALKALSDSGTGGKADGQAAQLPRYNKSAFGGKGDRHDEGEWPSVDEPVDVILFEGWMLGFEPVKDAGGDLEIINKKMGDYAKWNDTVDAWMVVRIDDLNYVYDWRMQAEQRMRSKLGNDAGMSDNEVREAVTVKRRQEDCERLCILDRCFWVYVCMYVCMCVCVRMRAPCAR